MHSKYSFLRSRYRIWKSKCSQKWHQKVHLRKVFQALICPEMASGRDLYTIWNKEIVFIVLSRKTVLNPIIIDHSIDNFQMFNIETFAKFIGIHPMGGLSKFSYFIKFGLPLWILNGILGFLLSFFYLSNLI